MMDIKITKPKGSTKLKKRRTSMIVNYQPFFRIEELLHFGIDFFESVLVLPIPYECLRPFKYMIFWIQIVIFIRIFFYATRMIRNFFTFTVFMLVTWQSRSLY